MPPVLVMLTTESPIGKLDASRTCRPIVGPWLRERNHGTQHCSRKNGKIAQFHS